MVVSDLKKILQIGSSTKVGLRTETFKAPLIFVGHIKSRSGAHAVKAIRCLNDFWSEGCEDLRSPSSGQHSKKGCTSLETICSSSHHLSISCISRNEPGGSEIHVNQVNRSIIRMCLKMRGSKKNPLASYSNASFLVVLVFLIFDSLMYDLNLYHNYGFEYSHDAFEAFSTSFDPPIALAWFHSTSPNSGNSPRFTAILEYFEYLSWIITKEKMIYVQSIDMQIRG